MMVRWYGPLIGKRSLLSLAERESNGEVDDLAESTKWERVSRDTVENCEKEGGGGSGEWSGDASSCGECNPPI